MQPSSTHLSRQSLPKNRRLSNEESEIEEIEDDDEDENDDDSVLKWLARV